MDGDVFSGPRAHPWSRGFEWRDAPRTGMWRLAEGEIDRFNAEGFVVMRGVFTADEIAAVRAEIDPFEAAHAAAAEAQGGRMRLTDAAAITFTLHLVKRSAALKAFAAHPAIRDICHDLIGPEVRLYWDQAVYKKTEKVQEFPWHQDNGYSFVEPQQYLTLWVPLVDVDEENGCPWIARGLHRMGTLEHRPTEIGLVCLEATADAVAAPARVGDVVVFSSLAPHRTGPNLRPGSVRKAYILQFAPDGAVVRTADGRRTPQDDPERQFTILTGRSS